MNQSKAHLYWYLILLLLHLAHIIEEVCGRFRAIDILGSMAIFVAVNVVLFIVPIVVFIFIWRGYRRALYAGLVYAILMTLNGLGHITGYLVTGRYFGGFAGAISGIGFILVAPLLVASLRRELHCRADKARKE
nr:hypothetical protein [candidate division Zixibacteria bacterium]